MLNRTAEAKFLHILMTRNTVWRVQELISLIEIDYHILILLNLDITSLTVVRWQIHETQVNELLQYLQLRLTEREGIARLCLPREDSEGDVFLVLDIAAVPHHLRTVDLTARGARDGQS